MDPRRNFFRHGLCHICKRSSETLKRCSSCKTLSYCSREHQLQDWKDHKELCKVIATTEKIIIYNVSNYDDLKKYKEDRGIAWQIQLKRGLERFEAQMWMYARVCAICYKREDLFDCKKCLSEYYCSTEHQDEHSHIHEKFCKELKLSLEMEVFLYYNDSDFNIFSTKRVKDDLKCIPENRNFINCVLKSHSKDNIAYLNSCDQNLSGITILFGLEQAGVIVNRKLPKKSLEIHIVGATPFEFYLNWVLIIEIYFHWIKNLEEIHIVFIGLGMQNQPASFQLFKTQFCQNCQAKKNLIVKDADLYKNVYYNVANKLEKPDIVVAFNNGLHEFMEESNDSWKNSLSSLVQFQGVPLLLTAYSNEEIQKDLCRIKNNAKAEIVYGPARNPFSNLRPLIDWAAENIPIYYINNFIVVIRKI